MAVGGVSGLQRQRPGALPPRERVPPVWPVELFACVAIMISSEGLYHGNPSFTCSI